jgi:hypothetical protein
MRKFLTAALLGSSLALAACGDADDTATDDMSADEPAMAPAPADTGSAMAPAPTDTAPPEATDTTAADDTATDDGDDAY